MHIVLFCRWEPWTFHIKEICFSSCFYTFGSNVFTENLTYSGSITLNYKQAHFQYIWLTNSLNQKELLEFVTPFSFQRSKNSIRKSEQVMKIFDILNYSKSFLFLIACKISNAFLNLTNTNFPSSNKNTHQTKTVHIFVKHFLTNCSLYSLLDG